MTDSAPITAANTNAPPRQALLQLNLFLAVLAIIGVLVVWQQTHRQNTQIKRQHGTSQLEIEQKIADISMAVSNQQNAQLKMQENFSDMLQNLQTEVTHLKNQQTNSPDTASWVLAEVNYLTMLASYSINFVDQHDAALQLLQKADNLLSGLHNPAYLPIRQMLAEDMRALQAVPQIDYEGLLLKIEEIKNAIPQLTLLPAPTLQQPLSTNSEIPHGWKARLHATLITLGKLVVIRYHDKPLPPLPSEQQLIYANYQLQFLLQQINWALLQQQPQVYQHSLDNALHLVTTFYDNHNVVTQKILVILVGLKHIDVKPKLPDLSATCRLLQQMLQTGASHA